MQTTYYIHKHVYKLHKLCTRVFKTCHVGKHGNNVSHYQTIIQVTKRYDLFDFT